MLLAPSFALHPHEALSPVRRHCGTDQDTEEPEVLKIRDCPRPDPSCPRDVHSGTQYEQPEREDVYRDDPLDALIHAMLEPRKDEKGQYTDRPRDEPRTVQLWTHCGCQ